MRLLSCVLLGLILICSSEAKPSSKRSSRAGKYQAIIRQVAEDLSILVSR